MKKSIRRIFTSTITRISYCESRLGTQIAENDAPWHRVEPNRITANSFYSIHKILHWWIGLKACNVILARDRLDRERRKKAENRQARAEAEFSIQHDGGTPASFVALAPNSIRHETDTASRGSPMSSTAMLTPPESGESPAAGTQEGFAFSTVNGSATTMVVNQRQSSADQQTQGIVDGIWSRLAGAGAPRGSSTPGTSVNGLAVHPGDSNAAVQRQVADANQAAVDRQISVEVAKLVASFRPGEAATEETPQPNNSIPYRGLDHNGLRAIRQYIYGEPGVGNLDEENLLNYLELTWREGVRGDYDKMTENIPVFIARERAILTWIELKRHLAALERADKRKSSPCFSSYTYSLY